MEAFTKHTGVLAPMDRVNVDTDQIIPKQYLKSILRTGYGVNCFNDWRYREDGSLDPDFTLNRAEFQGASILVARRNFGCGSSREHAPWALQEMGFKAVIAPSFADIFRQNSMKNGLVPVILSEEEVDQLFQLVAEEPGCSITVDLERQVVEAPSGFKASFEFDPFRKHCLVNGLDDIGLTLAHADEITAYESKRLPWLPKVEAV